MNVGWIPEAYKNRLRIPGRSPTLEIKKLVNADLLRIANLVREVSSVSSLGNGRLVKFVSEPLTTYCAVVITDAGKQLVTRINLSRRADACIAEGSTYIIHNFINTLAIADLPEFLSHGYQQLRDEAAERLDGCLKNIPSKDLPELLTDSDSIIRDTASNILVHSIGVEE